MTLTNALNTATTSLQTYSGLSSVVSRNVAGAEDANYAHRSGNIVTLQGGGIQLDGISRSVNSALQTKLLQSTSEASGQSALVAGLNELAQTIGDPELDNSPTSLVGELANALNGFASRPSDESSGRVAVEAARNLATGLNQATDQVQQVRQRAETDILHSVNTVNQLLEEFQQVNESIITANEKDLNSAEYHDQRDRILADLSQEMGIRTLSRSNGDMALFTDSGVTLFDKIPRTVEMQATPFISAGEQGNAVYVDGVSVTGEDATMPIHAGRIAGLTELRDGATVDYQNQLDELARGLIDSFAENDLSASPSLPSMTGLFSYSGEPAVPATGVLVQGLAGDIKINANVDPALGGDVFLLRDGSIGDPGNLAYVANTTGASGYSDRLNDLYDSLSNGRDFDAVAELGSQNSVSGYAAASAGWISNERSVATVKSEHTIALKNQGEIAFSNATGVNLDEEMMRMLSIERSYQASTKLIQTIDSMFQSLFAMVR